MLSWGNETSFFSLFVHHSWRTYMHSHHHCYLIVSQIFVDPGRHQNQQQVCNPIRETYKRKDWKRGKKSLVSYSQLLNSFWTKSWNRWGIFTLYKDYNMQNSFECKLASAPLLCCGRCQILCNSSICFRVKARMQNEAADAARPGKSGIGPSRKTQQDANSFPTRYPSLGQSLALVICWRCVYQMLLWSIYLLCFAFCWFVADIIF